MPSHKPILQYARFSLQLSKVVLLTSATVFVEVNVAKKYLWDLEPVGVAGVVK